MMKQEHFIKYCETIIKTFNLGLFVKGFINAEETQQYAFFYKQETLEAHKDDIYFTDYQVILLPKIGTTDKDEWIYTWNIHNPGSRDEPPSEEEQESIIYDTPGTAFLALFDHIVQNTLADIIENLYYETLEDEENQEINDNSEHELTLTERGL